MSLITKNNYEAYLLDYVEENLSPELIAELMLFFENNPELQEDLEAFEIHELIAPSIVLVDKSQLKKDDILITSSNYEEFLIAEIEGLNTPEISIQLNLFLDSNPTLNKEFSAYQKTKLVAPSIIFNEKKSLLQKERKVIPLYWWSSSAAAAIVILVWFNGFNYGTERQYFPVAEIGGIMSIEDENEDSLGFYVFDDDKPQIALVEKSFPNKINKKENDFKKNLAVDVSKKEEINALASVTELEHVMDTLELKEVTPKEVEIKDEEILFAENSVRITYEDEVLDDVTPAPQKKKMSKFDIFRKVIKQQIKTNILDKGRDGILLAENSRPLNFIRGKKK
jgi:hypothetical protein